MKYQPLPAAARAARAPGLLLALLFGLLGTSNVARAETPYNDRQTKLAESVLSKGKSPSAVLDLLRMTRHSEEADPAVSLALFKRIAESKSIDVQHRLYASRRVAWDLRRTGDPVASVRSFDALGYVRAFRLIGPFDNEGKRGFDETLAPEEHLREPVNLDASYQGRERMVRWRVVPEIVQGGYVSFDAMLRPAENVCGFAETTLQFDKAQPATLWVGGGGAIKVYFNGVEVLRDAAYRAPHPDRSVALVAAQKGNNRLLVKSCVQGGAWGFYVRVGDARGEPLLVKADPSVLDKPPEAAASATPATATKAPASILTLLEGKAKAEHAKADDLENLARFLWYTGSDDPAEKRARQLALQAAEREPSAARYLLASSLAEERYEKLRYIGQAEALSPGDPQVILARAAITSGGPDAERALKMLDGVPATGVHGLEAAELRIAMLRQLGLEDSALAMTRTELLKVPQSTHWLGRLADGLDRKTRRDEALTVQTQILALRGDHVGARRSLIDDALAQRRAFDAIGHLEALLALFPGDDKRLVYASEVYDSLGREDMKMAMLTRALEIAPESEPLHVRMGHALLRAGQIEAAAGSLRKALALKPQDAETRELLEQLSPAPRRDESFALDRDKLLARTTNKNGHPVTILQDLTVNTVFENGLGSRFVQFAAQVHDAEGARRMRARSIQFDPESQRVDIRSARVYRADGRVLEATESYEEQLGEPWYRVYYDTRALVVVFPDLEPGDSIELRYRVDDVSPRNLYADYYGDMHFFQSGEPRAHVEYVLITPKKRTFYFNQPKLSSLRHTREQVGEENIDKFEADNVPALKPEPDLPGLTEIAPYLHVSTYKTWEEVGRWYWGLIQDQLYADESLKQKVKDIVKGEKDHAKIVKLIYGWVVKNTRYVALEFGIHGYLPYRVPDVVRRGFGDCKDKASLIYTMLREAGVDARLVLARTRRNGAITDLPASLSVFDHAIAYVPEFDMYLDGTAEHSGTLELPAGDQGITVLQVGPKSAVLTKTPVLKPSTNERARILQISLDADGSGEVSAEEHVKGTEAAGYRQTYQAEGTRKDRFVRSLSGSYPGLVLSSQSFVGLDDLEHDIEIRYSLRAPQLARQEGRELRIGATSVRELLREMAPIATRVYPLELGVLKTYREERTVHAPKGFKPGLVPAGGEVKSAFGSLVVKNELSGTKVICKTVLTFTVDTVDPAHYPAFRHFIEQADDILRQRIAFVPEKP